MTTGANKARQHAEESIEDAEEHIFEADPIEGDFEIEVEEERLPSRLGARILAAVLILLALAWIGAFAWMQYQSPPPLRIDAILPLIVSACIPLLLIGMLWMIFGGTSRRETERFIHTLAAMRRESTSLEQALASVAERLQQNHERLTDEASKLMSLGDEASDRLGRVAHYIAKESAALDRRAEALEVAAANARVDIGVLLEDLPRAEAQAIALSDSLRKTGLSAHEQAGSLEGQLSALIARGREADEVVGGAAQRLAAHLARIESSSAEAAARMDEVAANLSASIDASMAHAADAIESTRSGIDQQGAALVAMVEQNQAVIERTAESAGRKLAQQIDTISAKVEGIAAQINAQETLGRSLSSSLSADFKELEVRFAQLREIEDESTSAFASALAELRSNVERLHEELRSGTGRTDEMIERSNIINDVLGAIRTHLQTHIPGALSSVEEQSQRLHASAETIGACVGNIQATARRAAEHLSDGEESIARQQENLDILTSRITDSINRIAERIGEVNSSVAETDDAAHKLASETGRELLDALVRVREAASQAANHARDAITAVIPQAAVEVGGAAREAVKDAVTSEITEQLGSLGTTAEEALEAARKASERLTRQMLKLGETTAVIEARIESARREREEKDSEKFSRRVALLIESLNSTAIDVTKILSNEITDSAWAAYLRGDRGVFTRRAVRLLKKNEVREIRNHYENDREFADQVNRYIHDFEAMLRQIMGDRESSALAITLLSSDMGKLYVALAQAIERIRT